MAAKAGVKSGDALFFSADAKTDRAASLAGQARIRLGRELNLIRKANSSSAGSSIFRCTNGVRRRRESTFPTTPSPCRNTTARSSWRSTSPTRDTILGLKAYQYDIVCNGIELSSGAIRNHDPEVMLRRSKSRAMRARRPRPNSPGMLNAFRYGAPPHGGTAPGIDRIVMLIAGEENLRAKSPCSR